MVGFVRGELCELTTENAVIDVNGIGMNVLISVKEAEMMPLIGNEVKLYTYLSVREDAMKLYGFLTREDLEFFKLLIGVNGIGPKGAQGILSAMGPDELRYAIMSSDSKTLSKCPGIGAKTAQRIILDLKDKIDIGQMLSVAINNTDSTPNKSGALSSEKAEALEALTALGFSSANVLKAINSIEAIEEMGVEQIIKEALRHLS